MPDSSNLDNPDLDALLDEALSSYIAAEPDPSLRARIMAHAVEASPRPKRLWLLAPAAVCAAALAIAFLLHSGSHMPRTHELRPEPSAPTSIAIPPEPAPAPARAAVPPATHPHPALAAHRTRRSEPPAVMRNASFPSPTPLTDQEKILLKFATEHPEQARQVLAAPASRPLEDAPLTIASIQIPALSETQQ